MSESFVQARVENDLYFVTLNRPEKRNALTPEMVLDLAAAVRSADEHPGVRAIIVNANGPIFSAGIDLMALAQAKAAAQDQNPARWLRRMADRLQDALYTIESTELPVIGALQGRVIGLGLEVALSFDFRIATDSCLLSIPESRMGLVADVGGTTRLCRLIGPSRAKDMLMTARNVDATEALQWGLVNRVVPEPQLMECATALAQEIAQNAPLAVGMAKLIVDQGDGLDKHTQLAIERWAQSQLISTEDLMEAVSAFMEKRPPQFKGK
ncbi:MAG: enoyl-CoA hydratase/isomerase family protein [Candidatus Hydrogenedentes bacterium]|nr:enoyl-CoA hydratase/isomerase family protein [Candidatus Hydrogenedentota bacterium]